MRGPGPKSLRVVGVSGIDFRNSNHFSQRVLSSQVSPAAPESRRPIAELMRSTLQNMLEILFLKMV